MVIKRYNSSFEDQWNDFVRKSKNATFLFERGFMEYHADRFYDHSILALDEKNEVLAVLPASESGEEVISHGGLTYGGLLMLPVTKTIEVIEILDHILMYLRDNSFKRLIYKAIPHIYHQMSSEEDLYALHRLGAVLYRRDMSQAIDMSHRVRYSKGRKWLISRAKKSNIVVKESDCFNEFMLIETETLKKHGVKPVHTPDEIKLLAEKFPNNIKLYAAYSSEKMIAGVLTFETPVLIHAQYIGSTDEGRDSGAAEFIIDYLLKSKMDGRKYFDFGISTEKQGTYLNEGLCAFKESFGARGVTYDFYRIDL